MSELFRTTPAWRAAYPGAQAGVLIVRGAAGPAAPEALAASQAALEVRLRARYAGQDRAAARPRWCRPCSWPSWSTVC